MHSFVCLSRFIARSIVGIDRRTEKNSCFECYYIVYCRFISIENSVYFTKNDFNKDFSEEIWQMLEYSQMNTIVLIEKVIIMHCVTFITHILVILFKSTNDIVYILMNMNQIHQILSSLSSQLHDYHYYYCHLHNQLLQPS